MFKATEMKMCVSRLMMPAVLGCTSDFSSTCVGLALVAGRQDCQPRPNSQRQPLRLFSQQLSTSAFLHDCKYSLPMHFNASRSLTQPLLDCMLYLTQYPYDPGTLPSSANQCILGNVYLRSNSRELPV